MKPGTVQTLRRPRLCSRNVKASATLFVAVTTLVAVHQIQLTSVKILSCNSSHGIHGNHGNHGPTA